MGLGRCGARAARVAAHGHERVLVAGAQGLRQEARAVGRAGVSCVKDVGGRLGEGDGAYLCVRTSRNSTLTDYRPEYQPIAARSAYVDPHTSSAKSRNATASSLSSPPPGSGYLRPFRIGLHDTRAQIASLHVPWFQAPSGASAGASSQRLADATPRPSSGGERTAARVEVALAIALPTQTPCAPGCVPLFALGVTNVRWAGGSLAQQYAASPPPSRYTHHGRP